MPFLSKCAHRVRLGEILRGSFFGAADIDCTACCGDPTQCQPGDVYFAVLDAPIHDPALIATAVSRGARAVVCEQYVPANVPVCVVGDVRKAYAQVCQALAGWPHRELSLVGVTGTSGKTVTTTLLQSILQVAGRQPALLNSLTTNTSVKQARTAPGLSPPTLASWLSDAVIAGSDSAVLEVSSQDLAEHRIAGLELDAVVLTNLRRDHLDLHNTVEAYRRCKRRIFRYLKKDGVAVFNADDPHSQPLIEDTPFPCITIGVNQPADIMAEVIERHASEQTFLLKAGAEAIPVRSRIIGNQHVYRCLAATALGLVWNIDLATIVRGLEAVESVAGQLERVECGQDFRVFLQQAGSPESLASALKALRPVTKGRVICVFSTSPHGDPDQRPVMGRVVERHANVRVLTQDDYEAWDRDYEIPHQVLDGMQDAAAGRLMPSRDKAVAWALEQARQGDSILIASHDPQQDIDREYVRQLLSELPPASQSGARVIRFPIGASLN